MSENKVIKVAHVIGMAIDGGVESCVMNYYRSIDRTKVQFDFLVESTSNIINKEKIEELGGRVLIIPSYKNPFRYMKELKKIFKQNKYDIVHSNMNALSVFTLRAAKKAGIKVRIAHSHSTSNSKEKIRNLIKNILKLFSKKYATDYFACSEKAGRWLFGNKTFDQGKVTIINNGIYISKFKFDPEMRKEGRLSQNIDDFFIVGHVGRFVTQKNHSFLFEIFNEVQKIRPKSALLLIGDGPLHEELTNKAKTLKIDDKVIFSGVHKHVNRYYQMMDCFVLPSLYEGLPVVGVEAQINGLPCFFSDTVTKEVGINDNVEFISLNKSAKEWAEEICTKSNICNSKEMINARIEYANMFVGSNYDIESEAKKLLELYRNLIKKCK